MRVDGFSVNAGFSVQPTFLSSYDVVFGRVRSLFSVKGKKSLHAACVAAAVGHAGHFELKKRKRRAFVTTDTELMAMAAPASMGESTGPPKR